MGAWRAWFDQNWFTLIQTFGIMGSLWLTALALRRDRRSRRMGDYLTLAQHHRDLWGDLHRRPELARVAAGEVDLVAQPITTAEEEFLLLVITHFHSGWLLAREGALLELDVLAQDARAFFRLPLPADVWQHTRSVRDPLFVRFIDALMEPPAPGRMRAAMAFLAGWCRSIARLCGQFRERARRLAVASCASPLRRTSRIWRERFGAGWRRLARQARKLWRHSTTW